MNNNLILPMEIVNKILIMRPTHPIVNILRSYINDNLDNFGVNNVIYCHDIMFYLQNNDCFCMEYFNFKYKSYRRRYKYCIDEIKRKIESYNIFKKYNDNIEHYTFKTFEKFTDEIDI